MVRHGATFSKHYFIESQRLVSKLGDMVGTAMLGNQPETAPVAGTTANAGTVPDYGAKTNASTQAMNQSLAALGIDAAAFIAGNSGKTPPGQVNGTENNGSGNDGTTTGNVPGGGEQFLYYYHGDHLGSTGYVTDASGEVYQHLEYFPFGETWIEEHNNTNRTPYLYTGKELDEETGLYYYGARYYDPRTSVWQSPDPILGQYMDGKRNNGVFNSRNIGLYTYSYQNPINLKDPDGRSTHVGADGDVITVFNDTDLGVYQHGNNADGGRPTEYMISKRAIKSGTSANGRNLGETATPYSFIGGDGKGLGSIDPKSTEGADFLKNEIIDADPSMIKYMTNARHGGKYDFKTKGESPAMSAKERDKHRYRGGVLAEKTNGTKVFASARDIGNIAAGYVARRKGLSWGASRLGFDGYQSLKQGKFESEGATTQAAEKYGYDMADKVYKK